MIKALLSKMGLGRAALHPSAVEHARGLLMAVCLGAAVLLSLPVESSRAEGLGLPAFGELALRCAPDVAPSTLASIGETESRLDPLMINDNTTAVSVAPLTREIAVQTATRLLEAGHSVDLGLMQINSANLLPLRMSVADAFDPCKSLAGGAAILTGSYTGGESATAQQSALRVALSRYNTGDGARGFANGYVHRVELAAQRVHRLVPALDVAPLAAPADQGAPAASASPRAPKTVSWDPWARGEAAPPESVGLIDAHTDANAVTTVAAAEIGNDDPRSLSPIP